MVGGSKPNLSEKSGNEDEQNKGGLLVEMGVLRDFLKTLCGVGTVV